MFFLFFFVCERQKKKKNVQCCLCLWIVHSWLSLRFSLSFFYNVLCASLHFISAFCSSNVYQCYDQSCVSKGRLCDRIPDCSGRYFEDETECQRYHVQDSCEKWWMIGARSDGMYRIDYGTTGNWIMLTFSTGK